MNLCDCLCLQNETIHVIWAYHSQDPVNMTVLQHEERGSASLNLLSGTSGEETDNFFTVTTTMEPAISTTDSESGSMSGSGSEVGSGSGDLEPLTTSAEVTSDAFTVAETTRASTTEVMTTDSSIENPTTMDIATTKREGTIPIDQFTSPSREEDRTTTGYMKPKSTEGLNSSPCLIALHQYIYILLIAALVFPAALLA